MVNNTPTDLMASRPSRPSRICFAKRRRGLRTLACRIGVSSMNAIRYISGCRSAAWSTILRPGIIPTCERSASSIRRCDHRSWDCSRGLLKEGTRCAIPESDDGLRRSSQRAKLDFFKSARASSHIIQSAELAEGKRPSTEFCHNLLKVSRRIPTWHWPCPLSSDGPWRLSDKLDSACGRPVNARSRPASASTTACWEWHHGRNSACTCGVRSKTVLHSMK